MTRSRDLYLRDIFECNHEPETPITENGAILYWLCRCGQRVNVTESKEQKQEGAK